MSGARMAVTDGTPAGGRTLLVYRQSIWTRATHWVWAICLFFLLLSGLQIFNAHPKLYVGAQSGFAFDNAVLSIGAVRGQDGSMRGSTTLFGLRFDTTGFLGVSGANGRPHAQAFPAWATIPSYHDLATGRVVHFFFAWLFVGTLALWLVASLANRHVRDVVPTLTDLKHLPRDVRDHARLRLRHGRSYNALQKLTYFVVLFGLFPTIVLTGLTMSPAIDAAWPWLVDLFGGRQTARSIHFLAMALIVLFFVVHVVMVVAAGPINEMRSMITGWYRVAPDGPAREGRL